MARRLTRYRAADFLEGVPASVVWRGPSERMRRNPHYRRIAQLWRLVHERPFVAVHSPAFALPLNDIPTLYEQWCLLEVARVLPSCGTIVDQDLLRHEGATEPDGGAMNWHVRIGENRPLLRIARSDVKHLALWYRRRYKTDEGHGERLGSLDPFLRVPDIVIEVTGAGAVPAVLVFDAKYRVSPAGGIPEDALADAYTYHQALGYGGQQVSRGAFLLFPGEAGFVAGDVGAVALVPGRTAGLWALLTQRLAAM
jgi:large subunit ribosomal protein MRP49